MKFEVTTLEKYLFKQCLVQGSINCVINFIIGWLLYGKRNQISSIGVLADLMIMTLISVFIIHRFQYRTARNDGFDNRVILSPFFQINQKYILDSKILANGLLEGTLLSIFLSASVGAAFFITIKYSQNSLFIFEWILVVRSLVAFLVGYMGASVAIILGVNRGRVVRKIYESNLQKQNIPT